MKPSDRLIMHRMRVLDILNKRGFMNPRLFGSAARRDDDAASDIDILIDAPAETSLYDLAAAEIELEGLLSCKVELLTEGFLAPDVRRRISAEIVPLP